MKEYHKIQTVFKRDPENNNRTLLIGEYSRPEFSFLADNEWVFTEKVDGTNIRVMVNEIGQVKLGGKTDNAQIPAFLVERLQDLFMNPEAQQKLADKLPDGGCLYGEGYGAKIQKGGNYKADGVDFVLFDVKVGEWWLEQDNIEDVASALSLDTVPIISTGTLHEMVSRVQDGFRSQWGDFTAEGIVARPATELRTRSGHRIITKIKYKDFPVTELEGKRA